MLTSSFSESHPIDKRITLRLEERIIAIADVYRPKIKKAFIGAVAYALSLVERVLLRTQVERGDVTGVARTLDASVAAMARRLAEGEFADALQQAVIEAGRETAKVPEFAATIRFNVADPRAQAFLRSYPLALIRDMEDGTRLAIRDLVRRAFEVPTQPALLVDQILRLSTFGLNQRQQQALGNYRTALQATDMKPAQVARLVEQYEARALRYRAEMIARSESIRAASAGQTELWRQAQDAGYLGDLDRKRWIITRDDRLCAECRAIPGLNPQGVPLGGSFATPFGPVPYPPAHTNCRCAVRLEVVDDE